MAETRSRKSTSPKISSNRTSTPDPLRILKADHREVEQLLERIAAAKEAAGVPAMATPTRRSSKRRSAA